MNPEDAFRRVLAARLPAGPGWTAWIDGTVSELAANVPVDPYWSEEPIAGAIIRTKERADMAEAKLAQIRALCDEAGHLIGEPAAWLLADKIRKTLEEVS